MHITFYHTALCPRCRLVRRALEDIAEKRGDMEIEAIDVLRRPRVALRSGIRMIPALQINDRVLSGLYLKRKRIRQFIDNS